MCARCGGHTSHVPLGKHEVEAWSAVVGASAQPGGVSLSVETRRADCSGRADATSYEQAVSSALSGDAQEGPEAKEGCSVSPARRATHGMPMLALGCLAALALRRRSAR